MAATRFLKLLFCFKKPELINFSYISVFIKNKPTLFIVWEIKNACSVKLIPLKRKYYTAKKAMVLSIPGQQEEIIFKAANYWRRRIVKLAVRAVGLDEAATAQLINGFRPLNKQEVAAPVISGIRNRASLKHVNIHQRSCVVKNIHRFNINIQPFTYPLNN